MDTSDSEDGTWRTVELDKDPSENVSDREEEGESNALVRSNPLIQRDFKKNKILYLNVESIKMIKSWLLNWKNW